MAIARLASSSEENSTKAKPRGLLVARSSGRNTSTGWPTVETSSVSSSLVVLKLRFPTKIFAEMAASLAAAAADAQTQQ